MPTPLALITGGTSGIGFAIAKMLASSHRLALIYRDNHERAQSARAQLLVAHPGAELALIAEDLGSPEGCARAWQQVRTHFAEEPEIFVHCAGRPRPALFLQQNWQDIQALLNDYLISALALTQLVLPGMYRRKSGKIIFLGSVAAQAPREGQAVYAAAKGALESFTRALALEVAHQGVRVNCLAPTLTHSPGAAAHVASALAAGKADEILAPDEVARALEPLLSPEGAQMTGKILPVRKK